MRIALDLDGTLADTHLEFIKVYNKRKEASLKLEDFHTYHLENAPFSLETFHEISRENWKTRNIPLTESSIPRQLRDIAEEHTIDIVTARGDVEKEKLAGWARDKGIPFESFIVDTEKTHLDYEILIDDCPHYMGEEMNVLLYHRPYNRKANLKGCSKRVQTFKQVKKHVL